MTVEEAKVLLGQCSRYELRDHAFGDCEVTWITDEVGVAYGHFGPGCASVAIYGVDNEATFEGAEAVALRDCGTLKRVDRNDTVGPGEYKEGTITPGLTLEGVCDELTSSPAYNGPGSIESKIDV